MRNLTRAFGLSLLLCMLGAAHGYAQDDASGAADNIEIEKITCREMLKMGNEERDFTMIFLHGFVSGKKSEMLFDGSALADATDAVLDTCINNPDDSLLVAFEKARG